MTSFIDFRQQAAELATRDYDTVVVADDGAGGFCALTPEIDGCITQGETIAEARTNLLDARILVIDHLLQYGLPVPPPAAESRTYCGSVHWLIVGGVLV